MTGAPPEPPAGRAETVLERRRGGDWAYVSLVSALPWLSVDRRLALGAQFLGFQVAAVALAAWVDRWNALPLASVAIVVSTLGSALMVSLRDRLGGLDLPESYRRLLFESSVDVVMGLVAFVALVTYLLVDARGTGPGALARLVGGPLPAPAVFVGLLVAWDLCYRIGTGWWASVTGLWRALALDPPADERTRRAYVRADLLTMGFAGLQLALVPFLWPDRLLALLVLGHVGAVVAVSGLAVAVQRRQ